ncbi:hypothetical protein CRYUN_Cryun19dG0106500 [Craigia yunnanensis]
MGLKSAIATPSSSWRSCGSLKVCFLCKIWKNVGTGFVWMKQKAPYEHFFVGTNTRVSYATEVTAYVEKFKMKKMTGVKSKHVFLWVPITEMSIEDPATATNKIYFKTPMGIGKSFPITAFMTDEENQKYRGESQGMKINACLGLLTFDLVKM